VHSGTRGVILLHYIYVYLLAKGKGINRSGWGKVAIVSGKERKKTRV